METEVWFENFDGLKFVEYLGEGADDKVRSIGKKFKNALESDAIRRAYANDGNIIFLVDGDEVVANTYFSKKQGKFTLFLEEHNKHVINEHHLCAFYKFLESKGFEDQFVDACTYPTIMKGRREMMENLAAEYSRDVPERPRRKP